MAEKYYTLPGRKVWRGGGKFIRKSRIHSIVFFPSKLFLNCLKWLLVTSFKWGGGGYEKFRPRFGGHAFFSRNFGGMKTKSENVVQALVKAKERKLNIPADPNAPLRYTSHNRVVLSLIEQRKKNKELELEDLRLEREKQKMAAEFAERSMEVDSSLSSDITGIMNQNEKTMTPFMKLFWEQKKKASTMKSMLYLYHL